MRFKIGGGQYDLFQASQDAFNEHLHGDISYIKRQIRVWKGMQSDELAATTLFHEMLHGVLTFLELDFDEKIVTVLSNMLVGTLEDNGVPVVERFGALVREAPEYPES